MPHTSHKKESTHKKRVELTDDAGWTHVTSTKPGAAPAQPTSVKSSRSEGHIGNGVYRYKDEDGELVFADFGPPAEPPNDLTEEKLLQQYRSIEQKWKETASYRAMEEILHKQILTQGFQIANCVCFGLGSPSGLLYGWIDRCHVSLYQLAAFVTAVEIIAGYTGQRPQVFAQEPCFNALDAALLRSLCIETVEHPVGFEVLTCDSFAFCPGAEQNVLLRALSSDPAIYFGAKVETYHDKMGRLQSRSIDIVRMRDGECKTIDEIEADPRPGDLTWVQQTREVVSTRAGRLLEYMKNKKLAGIPDLDTKDYIFHDTYLHWRPTTASDGEEEQAGVAGDNVAGDSVAGVEESRA